MLMLPRRHGGGSGVGGGGWALNLRIGRRNM